MKERTDIQTQLQKYLLKFTPFASLEFYNPYVPRNHSVVLRQRGFLATDWLSVAIWQSPCLLFLTPDSWPAAALPSLFPGGRKMNSPQVLPPPPGLSPTSAVLRLPPCQQRTEGLPVGTFAPSARKCTGGAYGHWHLRSFGFSSGPDTGA